MDHLQPYSLSSFLKTLLDLVFPRHCLGCERRGESLCVSCLGSLKKATPKDKLNVSSALCYRDPLVKKAIWSLKFKGVKSIAHPLARTLYDIMAEEISDATLFENFHDPLIIPIPLSAKRQRRRGFNQAERIAQELLKQNPRMATLRINILKRIKETPPQASLDRQKRIKNLIGCFAVIDKSAVVGKNIILIDDVVTTGATLREARKVIKKAGARHILAFTVAH